MCKVANTILSFGIAMILLFFGMSFDEADVIFRTQSERTASVESVAVYSGGASISEVESVMPQTMSAKNKVSVGQLTMQSFAGKNDSKVFFLLRPVVSVSENNSNIDRVICVMKSPDIYHRIAVLNYIHDLDGKKHV